MNKDILMKGSKPKGGGVTDDVNLMASLGQAQCQLGGDDPTPAMGGIADNPDFHFVLVPFNSTPMGSSNRRGSRTKNGSAKVVPIEAP